MPDVAHRFCVRHSHNNSKTEGFGGQTIKDNHGKLPEKLQNLNSPSKWKRWQKLDSRDPEWFIDKSPINWSRTVFTSFPKCDVLLNNLCELFNSILIHARDKYT